MLSPPKRSTRDFTSSSLTGEAAWAAGAATISAAAAASVSFPECMNPPVGLFREQLPRDVAERLEFERIAARVAQEHRRLLAGLAAESHGGLDLEAHAGRPQARGQRLELRHLEHHAEVRHRH